jgi:hypothetical protein
LLRHAAGLPVHAEVTPQVDAIRDQRSLLANPDPVPPLCQTLTQALRAALVQAHADYKAVHEQQMLALTSSSIWQRLQEAQQQDILNRLGLNAIPGIQTATEADLLASLDSRPLQQWATLRDALPQRFQNALVEAARLLEPKAVRYELPHTTVKDITEFDAWADQVRQEVQKRLKDGPVIL